MPRSKRSQLFVRQTAAALIQRCASAHPGCLERLAADPLTTVGAWADLTLVMTAEGDVTAGCSVTGSYDYTRGRVVVARSLSRRRQNFTALHELGHHLQQHDEESVALLEAEPDHGIRLEDDVCDAFAAQVLIQDETVDDFLPAKGPTALSVLELFDHTNASREACAVRAAQRIMGEGYVMLCDLSGIAIFTASTGPFGVRRNTPQTGNVVIEAAQRWKTASRESRVTFPSGAQSPLLFANAAVDGDYLFAVFVSQRPAWVKGLTPTLPYPNLPIGRPMPD